MSLRGKRSYNDPLGLILKREASTLRVMSFFFFAKLTLHHVVGGKVGTAFFLENCQNSRVCVKMFSLD